MLSDRGRRVARARGVVTTHRGHPLPLVDLLRRPVVVSPMAGGATTPGLVVAAAEAGALAFLAAGYQTADALAVQMDAVRASTSEPFGVNVFVPGAPTDREAEAEAYARSLTTDAAAVGAVLGHPSWDDDGWVAKVDLLLTDPPPVVSFTFGCPQRELLDAFRAAGSVVLVTVTTPVEARAAAVAGADGLSVQGVEAGAHQGAFTNDRPLGTGTALVPLLAAVAAVTDLPLIGAGGIVAAEGVRAVLDAGAIAAQCGTAFLRCPESGAPQAHKDALADDRFTATAQTRAFSGRPARGLVNQFMVDHPAAPAAYPEINNLTRPLRAAATKAGDLDHMGLWAGTGFREARDEPVGAVVDRLDPGGARR